MIVERRELSRNGQKFAVVAVTRPVTEIDDGLNLERMFEHLDKHDTIVDLSGCPRFNTLALGALVRGLTRVATEGKVFRLAGLSPQAKELLELTYLDGVFEIFDSVEQAADAPLWEEDARK